MSRAARSFLGFLLALSALSVLACNGGSEMMSPPGQGRVQLSIAATGQASVMQSRATAPADHDGGGATLQAATATFSSIEARTVDGHLVPVTIELPTTVDLLALGGGDSVDLPAGFLPPGTYDQLVVVISSLDLTLSDGTHVAITPPGGGWTATVPVSEPFEVVDGQTTTITLTFRTDLSFGFHDGHWQFGPRFECDGADHGHDPGPGNGNGGSGGGHSGD